MTTDTLTQEHKIALAQALGWRVEAREMTYMANSWTENKEGTALVDTGISAPFKVAEYRLLTPLGDGYTQFVNDTEDRAWSHLPYDVLDATLADMKIEYEAKKRAAYHAYYRALAAIEQQS